VVEMKDEYFEGFVHGFVTGMGTFMFMVALLKICGLI